MVAQRDQGDIVDALVTLEQVGEQGRAGQALAIASASSAGDPPTVERILAAWLHAKATRTGSAKTRQAYAETFASFRAYVQAAGLGDVDAPYTRTLADALQLWANRPRSRDGRPVSPATANQRAAIVSSFYTFARKRGLLMALEPGQAPDAERKPVENPATYLDRKPVQAFAAARALDYDAIQAGMERIDRTTPAGARDYALLMLGLRTGRRLRELTALTWGDLYLSSGRATITWQRTKGGKVMVDTVSQVVTDALLAALYATYGPALGSLAHAAPVFVSLASNTRGHALTAQAAAMICEKWLGTTKLHALRHTFAVAMDDAGAPLSEIQARLGHANAATTSLYLTRLRSHENAHGDALDALFGWGKPSRSASRAARAGRRAAPITRPLGRTKAGKE